jgi:3-oxoacyl-ACP reductase-like protein
MASTLSHSGAILLVLACTISCALRDARVLQRSSWSSVMALASGTSIQIELTGSMGVAGTFINAQQDAVVLQRGGERTTVSRDRIDRIWQLPPQRRDRLLDGALWGLAIGAAVGIAFTAAAAESEGALTSADWVRGVGIPAAVGAVIGVLIDSRKHSPSRIEIYRK